jgi:hypothetical protein
MNCTGNYVLSFRDATVLARLHMDDEQVHTQESNFRCFHCTLSHVRVGVDFTGAEANLFLTGPSIRVQKVLSDVLFS